MITAPNPLFSKEGEGRFGIALRLHVFNPTLNLFLFPCIKRTGIRATQVAADAACDRDFFTVVVTAFRAGETFAGTFKFTGETAFVAFVDWCVGAVVRHAVVAIIPHIFQCFQVVLNVRVFAVANEAAAGEWRVHHFKIQFVVWIDFFLYVQVIAVGIVAFVGDTIDHAELFGIETAETIAQVFTWRGV